MPTFTDVVTTPAPPEEVWKILHDPSRLPEWWADLVAVDVAPDATSDATHRIFYADQPDVARPQRREPSNSKHRIMISCLSTDIRFTWTLEPVDREAATRITVDVDIPQDRATLLGIHRRRIATSLRQLAALAAGRT